MKKFHFIGGEKGGVGKSFTARLLAQYYIDQKKPFIGFDTDQSHGTFSRFYGEFALSVEPDDIESMDALVDCVDTHPDCDIIVDLAAQTANNVFDWIYDCDFFQIMDDCNIQVYFWHILDDSADCKMLLQSTLNRLTHTPAQLVIVKNLGRGDNFEILERSDTFSQALANHAQVISLMPLQSGLVQKIDFSNLSFWAAANLQAGMKRVELQRVRVWLNKQYQQLDRLFADQPVCKTHEIEEKQEPDYAM